MPGTHRITAHADIYNSKSKIKIHLVSAESTNTPVNAPFIITHLTLTLIAQVSTDLQSLYSEQQDCSAPWRSSVPAAGHWPQTAVDDKGRLLESFSFKINSKRNQAVSSLAADNQ